MRKGLHFVSLGCPKNLVDSEMMLGQLLKSDYEMVTEADGAHTAVVNTCGFIEDAKKESIEKIIELARLKTDGKLKKLVVAGCLAQRYKADLANEIPEADVVIGAGEFQKLGDILRDHRDGQQYRGQFHLPTFLQVEDTPRVNSEPFYRAYLKISEGCKKRCAFCAIPVIRGDLQSRKLKYILTEAKLLVAGGVREINVISHDFTDFGLDIRQSDPTAIENPVSLLQGLSDVPGLDWIRVLYLYPDGVSPELIGLIRDRPNLVKYFDMPLQHVTDRMLRRMNRKTTRDQIEATLNLIREEIPQAVIRTQFIVGFPGETEEDFLSLLEFIKSQRFDRVGCFKYSREEQTGGYRMQDQVDEDIKEDRHNRLMELQQGISREKHAAMVGRTISVILDGVSEETDLLLQGRSSQQAPGIDGVVYINEGVGNVGDIVKVQITDSHDYDLVGSIIGPSQTYIDNRSQC